MYEPTPDVAVELCKVYFKNKPQFFKVYFT